MKRYEVDADIRNAWTIDASVYHDPEVFEHAKRDIFARSWQLVGDLEQIKAPGQLQPLTLLDGCLGEPLLLTRDDKDQVHCLSNVCTHRGMIVCERGGRDRSLRCPYHGRRFDLDGSFRSMPEFEQAQRFPAPSDDLPRYPHRCWGPFIFASLNPAHPFEDLTREMTTRLHWAPLDALAHDPTRSRDYLVHANWALYCENYLEGFHIPYVHASLTGALDYGEYAVELYPLASLQLGIAKGAEDCFSIPQGSPDHARRVAAYYYWLFPNTMFNVYPWGISVNVVEPLAPELTKVRFLAYVWDRARLDRGAGAGLDRVEREDEAIVEAVQRGVRSRAYSRGRYSPAREQGVHHFHRLLAQHLG